MSDGRRISASLLGLGLGLALMGCASPRMDFSAKRTQKQTQAPVSQQDFELNLQLLGDRKHRLAHRVRGRDVRRLLPKVRLKLAKGDRVFAVLPAGRSWRRVCWRSARVEAVTQQGATLITEEGRRFEDVPPAMIHPQVRGPLRAGQVVRVHSGRQLPFGRVASIKGVTVGVRTPWLGRTRVVDARRYEVLPLASGLRPAGLVSYRFAGAQRLGSLVAVERKYRWVLGAEGVVHKLPWTRVKAVDLSRRFKPGDRVRAALPVGLRLASVTEALHDSVLYEVSWSATRRTTVAFSQVAPP